MRRWRNRILAVLGATTLAYGAAAVFMAWSLTRAERDLPTGSPDDLGPRTETISFLSRGGRIALRGWYRAVDSDRGTILFVHGIDGNRESDGAVHLARRLGAAGYSSLLFDLRAHGRSGDARLSGGLHEVDDVLGALDFLESRGTPAERVGLLGFSMGGAIALLAAGREPVGAVAVDSPFADVRDMIGPEAARRSGLPEWFTRLLVPGASWAARSGFGIDVSRIVPERAAAAIPIPIWVVHGTDDERIPVEHGRRVYEAAPPGTRLWLPGGVGHAGAFEHSSDAYVASLVAYLDSRFGHDR